MKIEKKLIVIVFSITILALLLPKFSIAEDVAGCTCDSFWHTCGWHTIEDDDGGPTFVGLLDVGWDLGHHEDYCEVQDIPNGLEGHCHDDGCASDFDCLFGYADMARLRRCPASSTHNGHPCFLRCDGEPGHHKDFSGAVWDAWDRKCITCNGVLEDLVYGDSHNDIYCNSDGWDPQFVPIAGDGDCESACGAHPDCDDNVPGEYQEFGPWIRCGKGAANRQDYCTDSCNFQDMVCSASGHFGCFADLSCDGKYPGETCDTGGFVGFCSDTCLCDLGCPPCMAECYGPVPDDCETNICTDENNCGGCGQVCDIANDDADNHIVDPITDETCKMGWCDCEITPIPYSRYGACKPLTQYSWLTPYCVDGSDWGSCLTPWAPFQGFSLWTRTNAAGITTADDLCGGPNNVEYVARRNFVWNTLEEEWLPEYTIYSCNYPFEPFNTNFNLVRGVGYLVYPATSPSPAAGLSFGPIDLYPGLNFVGVTGDVVTETALDTYIRDILPITARYNWICGR